MVDTVGLRVAVAFSVDARRQPIASIPAAWAAVTTSLKLTVPTRARSSAVTSRSDGPAEA